MFFGIAFTNICFYLLLAILIIKYKWRIFDNNTGFALLKIFIIYSAGLFIINFFAFPPANFKLVRHLVKIILIFLMVKSVEEEPSVVKNALFCFSIAGFLSILISLSGLFFSIDLFSDFYSVFENQYYLNGIAGEHHIRYSFKLGIALIFLITYIIHNYSYLTIKTKGVIFFAALIIFIGILFSGSRGVLISLVVSSAVLLWFRKIRKSIVCLVIGGIIIFIPSYFLFDGIKNRYNFDNMSSFNGRTVGWKIIFQNWKVFLKGYGTNRYSEALKQNNIVEVLPKNAHNIMLNYYIEYGITGIIIYIFFWAGILYVFLKENQRKIDVFPGSAFLWIFIFFHLAGWTEDHWEIASSQFSLSFALGLLLKKSPAA
ncbi:O-antigen ligase family protein [Candidatus Dependentiae bacterium]|nr:O-antigen ligase family protein [Candidatus Dependentiae bacterium]